MRGPVWVPSQVSSTVAVSRVMLHLPRLMAGDWNIDSRELDLVNQEMARVRDMTAECYIDAGVRRTRKQLLARHGSPPLQICTRLGGLRRLAERSQDWEPFDSTKVSASNRTASHSPLLPSEQENPWIRPVPTTHSPTRNSGQSSPRRLTQSCAFGSNHLGLNASTPAAMSDAWSSTSTPWIVLGAVGVGAWRLTTRPRNEMFSSGRAPEHSTDGDGDGDGDGDEAPPPQALRVSAESSSEQSSHFMLNGC